MVLAVPPLVVTLEEARGETEEDDGAAGTFSVVVRVVSALLDDFVFLPLNPNYAALRPRLARAVVVLRGPAARVTQTKHH